MGIAKEFREFAIKGNVVDMAVGVIMGSAFGKIVSSLVSDVIMPPLGLIVGGLDFSQYSIVLKEGIDQATTVSINYGKFLQTSLDFTIQAFAIFMFIKAINTIRRGAESATTANTPPPEPSAQEKLLAEIRDLLRAK